MFCFNETLFRASSPVCLSISRLTVVGHRQSERVKDYVRLFFYELLLLYYARITTEYALQLSRLSIDLPEQSHEGAMDLVCQITSLETPTSFEESPPGAFLGAMSAYVS